MSGERDERLWEVGWEGHEREQRRQLARLSLAEKIDCLEEAQRVVEHLALERERRRSAAARSGDGLRLSSPSHAVAGRHPSGRTAEAL